MLSFRDKLQGFHTLSWLAFFTFYSDIFMSLLYSELCIKLQQSLQMCRLPEAAYDGVESGRGSHHGFRCWEAKSNSDFFKDLICQLRF